MPFDPLGRDVLKYQAEFVANPENRVAVPISVNMR